MYNIPLRCSLKGRTFCMTSNVRFSSRGNLSCLYTVFEYFSSPHGFCQIIKDGFLLDMPSINLEILFKNKVFEATLERLDVYK